MRTQWRRLRAAWVTLTGTGAAASVGFGLLVFASVLASLAIPRASAGLRNTALHRVIAASSPSGQIVVGTAAEPAVTDTNSLLLANDITSLSASFRARLAAAGVPLSATPPAWASLTTGFVPVTGATPGAGDGPPQLELTYRTALAGYSRVVAGKLPGGVSAASGSVVVQAAVTAATAARFGLRVGSLLTVGQAPSPQTSTAQVPVRITGIIQPTDPAAPFWNQGFSASEPTLTPGASSQPAYWTGAIFIGPGALSLIEASFNTDQMDAAWVYPVALNGLTAGQAGGVAASVASLAASGAAVAAPGLPGPATLAVSSPVPAILSSFVAGQSAVTPVLELLYVSLAVLGAAVVLLGARLVAQRRAAEFTLIRARGAALYQLGWLVLRASLVIAVVAGGAAAALAIGLTPGAGGSVAWWLAGVSVAVALVAPVLISVVPQRVAAPAVGRPLRRPGGRRPAIWRVVIETALVAASVGGLAGLRSQGLSSGSNGLYSSAAPVLIAIPVAVVVVRCYPLLARELARLAGRSRGVVAFVGLTRATRMPAGTILPSFALVLVLAMVAFPDMVATAEARSQVTASWRQVGADAIVQAPSGDVMSPALQRQIAAVPGVTAAALAVVEGGSLPNGSELSVVFTDPASYATVVDQAPGAPFPLAALSGTGSPGTGGQAVVPAVATPSAAQLIAGAPPQFASGSAPTQPPGGAVRISGGGPVPLTVGTGSSTLLIRLAGQVGSVPAVASDAIVVPLAALPPNITGGTDLMLLAGPAIDTARLSALVNGALPGTSVTSRAAALTALATSPVPQAAQTALTQGMAAAAGFGALVLLLSLLLTARTREITLAYLATMGLRRWQAQLVLAAETLPPVVAAALGGAVCAWLLAPLVGPVLDLGAFSGSGTPVAVTPAVLPLVAAAAGLVLAALLVLAAQAAITYYRGSTRALRIAD